MKACGNRFASILPGLPQLGLSVVCGALTELSAKVKPLVDVVADETRAEWILQVTTPEQARCRFNKIFKWQNIWRIAGAATDGADNNRGRLIFDVVKLKHVTDRSNGETLDESFVRVGQVLEFRFENDSDDDFWGAALFLDANFGINLYRAASLRSRRDWRPIRVRITDEALGTEGMVVFTVPMSVCRNEPDYAFLEQEPLGAVDRRDRGLPAWPITPFERLMRAATTDSGTRGGRILAAPSNPAVLSRSWVTVRAAEAGQP